MDVDPDDAIRYIGKVIAKETKYIPFNKKTFSTNIDLHTARSDVSTKLSKLLAASGHITNEIEQRFVASNSFRKCDYECGD